MSSGGTVSSEPSSCGPTSEANAISNRFAMIKAGFPDDQLYIIVLITQENLNAFQTPDQIHNNLFGKDTEQP